MAFLGTWTAIPVTELVGGEVIQWGDRVLTVEAAHAVELRHDIAVVPLVVTGASGRRRNLAPAADTVVFVQEV